MTRRCFLHVGSPKTGTSYLQNVLWRSRDELKAQGLHLPLRRSDHFLLTLLLREEYDPDSDPARAADVITRLEAALARTKGDVLITHELLSVVEQHQIDDFVARLRDFEVHVVVTTRSLDRQLPSEWQQFVKTRHTGTYDAFLEQVRSHRDHRFWKGQDFAAIAARWGASLPPSQVHIVTVPPGGAPPGELLRRFCSVVGVDETTLHVDVERDNASIGYEQAELLRRVNETLGRRLRAERGAYARVVKFFFAEKVLGKQDGQRLVLPEAERPWCTQASQEQAERIVAAGYDVVGDVDDLLPVWPTRPVEALQADDALLLEVALEATAELLVQKRADLETIWNLKQELREARGARASEPDDPEATGRGAAPLLSRLRSRLS